MNRKNFYIAVTWREGESSIQCLESEDFETFRRNMIDDGFENQQVEWYEPGQNTLPDRVIVFVYWEYPDLAPSYDQVRKWGFQAAKDNRGQNN